MTDPMPWVAMFRNGPVVGFDRIFSVGEPWSVIKLAPIPQQHGVDRWAIVGGDGIGEDPVEPWPDQVTYRCIEVGVGEIGDGSDREAARIAWYGLVDPVPHAEHRDDPDANRYWGD